MDKDEALKLALAALECKDGWGSSIRSQKEKAITAIKQALAAPAQEPVAWRWTNGKGWLTYGEMPHDRFESTPLYTTPPAQPAPVQPVWIQPDHLQKAQRAPFLCRVEPHKRDDFVPLYTTPPAPPAAQRQWVEVDQVKWDGEKFIAKLKEKNT
jgi:hypothetical protein